MSYIKPFYADDAKNALRIYARSFVDGSLRSRPLDPRRIEQWNICEAALCSIPPEDAKLLLSVYERMDTLADNVFSVAKDAGVSSEWLWGLLNQVEREVAHRQGMV